MTRYEEISARLRSEPRRFLVTGAAGFIGSHLSRALLDLGQTVVGLDNFATGSRRNLDEALRDLPPASAGRFRFIEGDIRDAATCLAATEGADVVLHQAALASVPRSMKDPVSSHSVNVDGFVNILRASQAAGVHRVVYASSSSVYGDEATQPKLESRIGNPLSPYAATKLVDEIYAGTFQRSYGIRSVGLRYFNVFGPRQDPAGPYAAVIPRWIENLLRGEQCVVFGDGTASRDFCFIENVVQANVLAAASPEAALKYDVFNVACGTRTTLLELFSAIRAGVSRHQPNAESATLRFEPARPGDIPHSLASIARAEDALGYAPTHDVRRGLAETIPSYVKAASVTKPSPQKYRASL